MPVLVHCSVEGWRHARSWCLTPRHAGLKSAEPVLGDGHPLLAQLSDQVALLQFFQGHFREAQQHAAHSLQASQALPEEEGRAPAVALCQLRLGTILLGTTPIFSF